MSGEEMRCLTQILDSFNKTIAINGDWGPLSSNAMSFEKGRDEHGTCGTE